jgi:signal-transduction protein with cAMP-binding, CBS, and nucleotidyltransferase domain
MNMERKEAVLKVRDVMTANPVAVKAGASVIDAARLMTVREISSILVKEDNEFVGIMTDRDIVDRVVSQGRDPGTVKVSEVMSASLLSISAEASVEEAAEKMRSNRIRRLVVEENHHKTGIIAESDMVRIAPELHFLIRERSKLDVQLNPTEPQAVIFAGFCEECRNYLDNLSNVNGKWLCEECRG